MSAVAWSSAALLTAAAILVLVRVARGPSVLNRVVAMEVLVVIVVSGFGVEAAVNRHATTLPILAVVSLVGFVGAVSVARFAAPDEWDDRT
ncbi:multisubunit sodium/proton antiporter MrpF subunit [Haloactinopolyspora alba]|uniref:Multisubunit sodium/proton antiporter MrpF subunit n=1 Tax=Haloactinopolyspora alba TaxID=648780 RepID=A0A2P8E2I6_9ACTN|nr:monovalent cation/H+ antiporter complex subunit F [Haloactinopolyspora alba]PSL03681.1 multisubunit sodium/proton antiporter MrpF subunit [Haloactinopolyspora alba]